MKFLLIRNGLSLNSNYYKFDINRDTRELKRGGTAPGESRKNMNNNYDLSTAYAANPKFQKINIASPNDNQDGHMGGKPRMKFSQPFIINRNEPIKYELIISDNCQGHIKCVSN